MEYICCDCPLFPFFFYFPPNLSRVSQTAPLAHIIYILREYSGEIISMILGIIHCVSTMTILQLTIHLRSQDFYKFRRLFEIFLLVEEFLVFFFFNFFRKIMMPSGALQEPVTDTNSVTHTYMTYIRQIYTRYLYIYLIYTFDIYTKYIYII